MIYFFGLSFSNRTIFLVWVHPSHHYHCLFLLFPIKNGLGYGTTPSQQGSKKVNQTITKKYQSDPAIYWCGQILLVQFYAKKGLPN